MMDRTDIELIVGHRMGYKDYISISHTAAENIFMNLREQGIDPNDVDIEKRKIMHSEEMNRIAREIHDSVYIVPVASEEEVGGLFE